MPHPTQPDQRPGPSTPIAVVLDVRDLGGGRVIVIAHCSYCGRAHTVQMSLDDPRPLVCRRDTRHPRFTARLVAGPPHHQPLPLDRVQR